MYGTHVILVDTLTAEAHDALVVGSQAARQGGPEEFLNLAYVRKDGAKHALHEHRILYRMAVRPINHPDVKQGKVTHWYKLPDEPVAGVVGNDARKYTIFLDGSQRYYAEPGNETIAVLDPGGKLLSKTFADIAEDDNLGIGPYPQGARVTDITPSDDGTMVNIHATSNPPKATANGTSAVDDMGLPQQQQQPATEEVAQ